MEYTRREFTTFALAAPALALLPGPALLAAARQAKPNSLFSGVQVGAISYSYRSMLDQSAEATLKYILDSGISAVELMGDPAESCAGRPAERAERRAWRTSVSMDRFKALRKMYNDAGVSIYAVKILSPNMSDEECDYVFHVAAALGCTHTTLELPTDEAQLKRLGEFAVKHKVYAAYHTHLQGSMTAFDRAFALSPGNMANVDLGHYVAAGNIGGTPVEFLRKHHARISSVHLKDRRSKDNGGANVAWGTGDTPIKDILQAMKAHAWTFPATVELEYPIPADSSAVAETKKCVDYCRAVLA